LGNPAARTENGEYISATKSLYFVKIALSYTGWLPVSLGRWGGKIVAKRGHYEYPVNVLREMGTGSIIVEA
jgi:hypothetical protein